MSWGRLLTLGAGMGVGSLLYGGLFGLRELRLERRSLRLAGWPRTLDGFRIAVLADPHIRDKWSVDMMHRAIELARAESPDVICLLGDFVSYWRPGVPEMVANALAPLAAFNGPKLAIAGNHDWFSGTPDQLLSAFDAAGIRLLRNENVSAGGITFVGLESALEGMPDPLQAVGGADPDQPMICLWHEPDWADLLPETFALTLSGHTHGGQFLTPWGWAPGLPTGGRRFVRGFFPHLPVPLYVSRGIGTTGPPSRLFCPGEVSLLRLFSDET